MFDNFEDEQYFELSQKLERYHSLFHMFWEMGKPFLDEKEETAYVSFDPEGNFINFVFGSKFWKESSLDKKLFVICHEGLHVILNHGKRFNTREESLNKKLLNIACDIVVNHILVREYGFNRLDIDPDNKYCWVDTIFKNEFVPDDKNVEFYYLKLIENSTEMEYELVDPNNHKPMDGFGGPQGISEKMTSDVIEKINDEMSPFDKNSLKDVIENHFEKYDKDTTAGTGEGNTLIFFDFGKNVQKKKKWESVIKEWTKKHIKNDFDILEHWARLNRRTSLLPEDIVLPSDLELDEKEEKSKIDLYFFLDVSGSCIGYAKRFIKAANSLPTKRFNIKLLAFDTSVIEIKKGTNIKAGGGTYFHILENKIQIDLKRKNIKKYPDAVFIITDGYGNDVKPEKPERWHWFLIGSFSSCIPSKSKIYSLKNFE